MRVNVYAEELTDRIQIIHKRIEGQTFTGLRIYLELPVTLGRAGRSDVPGRSPPPARIVSSNNSVEREKMLNANAWGEYTQVAGPFVHGPGDDDSSAITIWGKRDLRDVLRKALDELDAYYAAQGKSY